MLTDSFFLLSTTKYGDYDAVLRGFSKENGHQSFFIKGIFKPNNKKKAYLLPLNYLVGNLYKPISDSRFQNISKLESLSNFSFYENPIACSIVFFVADFLNQILRTEEKNLDIFLEIYAFNHELEQKNYAAHLFLLFRILEIQGLKPLQSNALYLDPNNGCFKETQSHKDFDNEMSNLWKAIQNEKSYDFKLNKHERKQILNCLLIYYSKHYPNFKIPQSLEVLQQLYN